VRSTLRIPVKLSTYSGDVVHPRSEATLAVVHDDSGGQHPSIETTMEGGKIIIPFPFNPAS
jgi:hypothetical protein